MQFLVVLTMIDPVVWRRIVVPETYTFWDLHVAIQDAMGWQDYHLHEFVVHPAEGGPAARIGIPDDDFAGARPTIPGWTVPLSRYFSRETHRDVPPFTYDYDFGDEWRHVVTLEELRPPGRGKLPRCAGGARRCPPEDCGGPPGYAEFLKAISSPRHREHKAMLEWCGGAYDPDAFDAAAVKFDDPARRWKLAFEGDGSD